LRENEHLKEQIVSDEELAKQLQAQFNKEAADSFGGTGTGTGTTGASSSSAIMTDEEYARRLQEAYLRYPSKDRKTGAKKQDKDKKEDKKEDTSAASKSLWGRLFGKAEKESDDDSDLDIKLKKKGKGGDSKKPTTSSSSQGGKGKGKVDTSSTATTGTTGQTGATGFPYYYPQQWLVNPGNTAGVIQYIPMSNAGTPQYYLANQ